MHYCRLLMWTKQQKYANVYIKYKINMTVATEQLRNPEIIDEEALWHERLAAVEEYAASGTEDWEPVHFLAGVEREFSISNSPQAVVVAKASFSDAVIASKLRGQHITVPQTEIHEMSEEESADKLAAVKAEAQDFVKSMHANNQTELDKQIDWLASIDKFTITDAVNFQLYKEFSLPTLDKTAVPQGANYQQMEQYAETHGWLEFRFGNGELQTGYYDNPGVCEMRLTPCPPTEMAERERIIEGRMGQLAGEFGAVVMLANKHINISAYREGANGVSEPILGSDQSQLAATLHALAGVEAAVEDGVWLSERQAGNVFNYYESVSEQLSRFTVSSQRRNVALRINPDRLELRSQDVMETTEQGMLWLMAGVTHGLRKGWGELAAEGYRAPEVVRSHEVHRTELFDKQKHLQIQRALQNSQESPEGRFELSHSYNVERAEQIASSLLGAEIYKGNKPGSYVMSSIAINSLRADNNGVLHCDARDLRAAYEALPQELQAEVLILDSDKRYQQIAALIDNNVKSVSIGYRQRIETDMPFVGKPPAARAVQMKQSEVMKLAYGGRTDDYTDQIMQAGQQAYDSIDLNNALDEAAKKYLTQVG